MAAGPGIWPALIVSLKAVIEFAVMLMVARAGVWLLCLGRPQGNLIYDGLCFLTRPVQALGALLVPRERASAIAGAIALVVCWLGLVWAKVATLAG
ncbi:MAG: hypothetical protein R3E87_25910 [Burkholderiaceae bacterium]